MIDQKLHQEDDRFPTSVCPFSTERESDRTQFLVTPAHPASPNHADAAQLHPLPTIYFSVDTQGVVLAVNLAGTTALGFAAHAVVGQKILALFSPKDQLPLQTQFAACLQELQDTQLGEFSLVRQDGTHLSVRVSVQILQTTHDSVMLLCCEGVVAPILDPLAEVDKEPESRTNEQTVTHHPLQQTLEELRGSEAELHDRQHIDVLGESEAQFRALSDCSPVGMFVADVQGSFTYVNQSFLTIVGCKFDQELGENYLRFLHPDDRDWFYATWTVAAKLSQTFFLEYRLLTPVREVRWVELQTAPLLSAQGVLLGQVGTIKDITECKQAQAALDRREQRFRSLADNSPDVILRLDRNLRHLYVNPAVAEAAGIPAEMFIGRMNRELEIPRRLVDYWDRVTQRVFETGQAEEAEFAFPSPDRVRYYQCRYIPEFEADGTIESILIIGHDITVLKQTEMRLRQQAEREQSLNHIVRAIRNSLDLETIFSTAVVEIGQLLQLDRVVIARYIPDRQLWIDVAEYRRDPNALSTLGMEFPDEGNEIVTKLKRLEVVYLDDNSAYIGGIDGSAQTSRRFWLLVPLHSHGNVWGSLGLTVESRNYAWQDWEVELSITIADQLAMAANHAKLHEQVHALNIALEVQVQERTAQLQQALELEAVLKRITDKVRDSLDEAQILQTVVQELGLLLNVECCSTSLYNLAQETSTVMYEYVANSSLSSQGNATWMQDAPDVYAQLRQGHHFQLCQIPLTPLSPCCTSPAILACPILDEHEALGHLWISRGSSESFNELEVRLVRQVANQCAIAMRQVRLYQEAQAQVKELKTLNELKDDFLSTVSHELRTPIASIKMATQMLQISFNQADIPDILSKQISLYLQILQDECNREINLINDLLDLSRLEAGTEPLTLSDIDLETWLSSLMEPFGGRTRNQKQHLEVAILTPLPTLTTDAFYLGRVVAELLNNACKYTPPGETIKVTAYATAPTVHIDVSNSGVEIGAKELTRIFDKFYRVPNGDPWKHGGTGLGLALVKKLVECLGGAVEVQSMQNQTTFAIELPIVGVGGD